MSLSPRPTSSRQSKPNKSARRAPTDLLAEVGIDATFVARGHDILAHLHVEKAESVEAKKERERLTKGVREAELVVSRILARLVAADEALALERADEGTMFGLDIIAADLGRQRAARAARATASSGLLRPSSGPVSDVADAGIPP